MTVTSKHEHEQWLIAARCADEYWSRQKLIAGVKQMLKWKLLEKHKKKNNF